MVFELERRRYGVAISWDTARKAVDLDLQVVLVDSSGVIVDAIYHNNLSAQSGAVLHTGDKRDASGDQFGELVWVDFSKIQMKIKLIIFVVAAASGGHLIDVRKGLISVIDSKSELLAQYTMERSKADVDAVVIMKRSKVGRWSVEPVDALAEEGTSFLDILDVLGELIKKEIPDAPAKQVPPNFNTDKRHVGGQPGSTVARTEGDRRTVSLDTTTYSAIFSWDCEAVEASTDVQLVLVNRDGYIFDVVNEQNVMGCIGAVVRKSKPSERGSHDMTLSCDLTAMKDVRLAIFILSVDGSVALDAFQNASLIFLDEREDKSKARVRMETDHTGFRSKAVLVLSQSEGGKWTMIQLNEEPMKSSTVYESINALGTFIKEFIPEAPQGMASVKLVAGKFSVVPIPQTQTFKKYVMVTISCTLQMQMGKAAARPEISCYIVMVDRKMKVLETVHVKQVNMAKGQVTFKDMDGTQFQNSDFCQAFNIALASAGKQVAQMLVFTTLSKNSVDSLRSATCLVADQTGVELASFTVTHFMTNLPGMLLARFYRRQDRSWSFQALGDPCDGREFSAAESLPSVDRVLQTEPTTLALNAILGNEDAEEFEEIVLPGSEQPKPSESAGAEETFAAPPRRTTMLARAVTTIDFESVTAPPAEAFMPRINAPHLLLTEGAAQPAQRGNRNLRKRHTLLLT